MHGTWPCHSARLMQETLDKLKSSQHELAAIQRQRDGLARQLALVADKIGSGVIPDPADLAVPEHIAAAAGASVTASAVRASSASLESACCTRHDRLLPSPNVAAGLRSSFAASRMRALCAAGVTGCYRVTITAHGPL